MAPPLPNQLDPVDMRDAVNAKSYELIAAVARTATFNGATVEIPVGRELIVTLDVTAASGTTPTLDVKLQHSPDGAIWSDLGTAFAQKTGVAQEVKVFTGIHGFVRVVSTIGGTTPSFTYSVYATGRP